MRLLFVLFVLFLPIMAKAQDVQNSMLCQQLSNHRPTDDVNFVAGRDDVVPADLNGAIPALLDPIRIPIRAPIDDFLSGRVSDLAGDTGSPPIAAFIEIYQDGRVLYNGADISTQTLALCDGEKIVVDAPTGHGQQGADVLKSLKADEPELIEIRKGVEGQALEGEILEGQYP